MEEGFVLDHGHGIKKYAGSWVAGKPEEGLFGARVLGKEKHPIRTFCCQKCGYLEGYVARG